MNKDKANDVLPTLLSVSALLQKAVVTTLDVTLQYLHTSIRWAEPTGCEYTSSLQHN